MIKGNTVQLVKVKDGKQTILSTHPVSSDKAGHLHMQVRNGKDVIFSYGRRENNLTVLNQQPVDGKFLPPWDRALRIGVIAKGTAKQKGVFEEFEVNY